MRDKPLRFIGWILEVKKEGVRKRFLQWVIPLVLPHYHLQKNGGGRRKKIDHLNIDDQISEDYRNSHLRGNFPGHSMGD